MNRKIILLFGLLLASLGAPAQNRIETGAEQTGRYLPLLEGRRVGIMTNHTGTVGRTHLVDTLRSLGVDIRVVFAPEHGFRGQADAGESVASYRDRKTGIDVVSVYGSTKHPPDSIMQRLDVLLFDIQDVGLRYYTYLSSMHYLMEACAANGKQLIVLDRPNPNGFYVDGPVLEAKHRSFVGMHPIPVVHGMTLGELACMIDGEGWLRDGLRCKLTVIPCRGYTHRSRYRLPTAPSPNLPNMRAVYLYPSLCFFEGTPVSLGRGTDFPFQAYGHPELQGDFSFTPRSNAGAKNPPLKDKLCHGVMALCYACHAEQRAFEPRADHSLAHRRAGFIEHPEQRAAFFAVSESLDYFEVAQSRNIKAHEIEFRIERYRRYVFKIVALNFGKIFERRSECRNRRARLIEFKLGETVFFEMSEYYFGA